MIIITPILIFSTIFPITIASQSQYYTKNVLTFNDRCNFENIKKEYEYLSYEEMTNLLHSILNNNSDIMSLFSIGKTFQGRDIWTVKISDNVSINEIEPDILLVGAHHGNEKPSYEVLIFFIKYVVENYHKMNLDNDGDMKINEDIIDGIDNDEDGLIDEDPSELRIKDIVNTSQIYIIPMLNPDGVEANTRKNYAPNYGSFGFAPFITSYGVDLNRNYGYKWFRWFLQPLFYSGSTNQFNTKTSVYRGEKSFCENETNAMRNFINMYNFKISLSYHTYGEYIVYPWGYTYNSPPDKDIFISIGENISAINNYSLIQGSHWYPTLGDLDDWLYGDKNVIAFTIELCKEVAPLDSELMWNLCYNHVGVNLFTCEIAKKL